MKDMNRVRRELSPEVCCGQCVLVFAAVQLENVARTRGPRENGRFGASTMTARPRYLMRLDGAELPVFRLTTALRWCL